MKEELCFVYLIGNNVETGYVGVSKNPRQRYYSHCSSKYPVGEYIRDNMLENEMGTQLKIIFTGTPEECFLEEIRLRPRPYMGLNISRGGFGGDRIKCLTEKQLIERNRKISISLRGRKRTQEHKDKVSKTKIRLKLHVGEKNGRAIKWKVISPDHKEYIIYGNFHKFCDNHNINRVTLRNHAGNKVPPIKTGGRGGFRPKNKHELNKRNNTVGWVLFKLEDTK